VSSIFFREILRRLSIPEWRFDILPPKWYTDTIGDIELTT